MGSAAQPFGLVFAAAICMLCPVAGVAESPCVAHYSESGEMSTGKTFRTWVEFPDADETRAFKAVGQFIASEGMLGLSTNKDIGVITAYQEDRGKRSPVTATFSRKDGGLVRVDIAFQLARGLRAPTAAIRDWLCKIAAVAVPADQRSTATADDSSGIMLRTSSANLPLPATVGKHRKAGFGPVVLFFYDFAGAHAPVRTAERQPSLVVRTPADPSTGYLLVRFEDDPKDDQRSVKMGSAGTLLKMGITGKGDLAPDADWTLAFTTRQESPGVWVVTPVAPMKPGEYGLWEVKGYGVAPFGVD